MNAHLPTFLLHLKRHPAHHSYRGIVIQMDRVDQLPDDGNVSDRIQQV